MANTHCISFLRAILWTAEEQGLIGAAEYVKAHQHEMSNIIAAMESDEGTFTPRGLEIKGSPEATCILRKILR